ncbi:CLIC5-like protein [Mya arenaria]|uniref:CLIC5-like protein n=1 Tax=Mya arenaria TaxID=6604 RepID=A0ABY7EH94_MYAAR|nr:chloride intracellular channel protein 5-like [Mya arenaria]WAR08312.1 CLIC5-like protein [Mya arenaria]
MSGDGTDVANGTQAPDETSDIPKYDLYIRASLIDNETQGACPMSQQGFMLSYILAQEKNVDFKVWTVSQVNPPADFKDKNRAKIYPFVEGISGKDTNGQSIAGVMPESADKVEDFFDSVNFDCPHLKRPKNLKDHILGKVDGITTQFNGFLKGLKSEAVLTNTLQKVDDHLASNGTTFLEGDQLSYTDCFLLPRLQHIIVAGEYFRGYEISSDMKHLWRYMRDAYDSPAFSETLPADEDLCKFHWTRLPDNLITEFRKNKIKGVFGVESPTHKTNKIPEKIAKSLDSASNGGHDDDDEEEEEEQEQSME